MPSWTTWKRSAFPVDSLMRVDAADAIEATSVLPASPAESVAFRPAAVVPRAAHGERGGVGSHQRR